MQTIWKTFKSTNLIYIECGKEFLQLQLLIINNVCNNNNNNNSEE